MEVNLVPFIVPNYVSMKVPPGRKEDGFLESPKWHLKELDTATLSSLCDEFRKNVFAKAEKSDPRGTP